MSTKPKGWGMEQCFLEEIQSFMRDLASNHPANMEFTMKTEKGGDEGILNCIDFDNVQDCILSHIVTHYRGLTCYVILQWDAEAQKFYEVEYRYDLPKCYRWDIVPKNKYVTATFYRGRP